ncbi:MAG TPA: hypothetical protein VJN70_20440 [Gemmatimonadaceae bacterium]|nr:hypothetical protein [Gemmatimonadaceae bacterium]
MTRDRQLGVFENLSGYVTTMRSIVGKDSRELEDALGFSSGSLRNGFYVFALDAPVISAEFDWKDRTMYSGGWHFDPTIGEYVQREDELRDHFGRLNNNDEARTDAKLDELMQVQRNRLNVREGPDRIVKVCPKSAPADYPDSRYNSIPQWRLRVKKPFIRLADVPPGECFT